jgi:hypothetical protein
MKSARRTLSGVVAGMALAIALSVPADFNGNMAEHARRYAHWDSLYWLGVRWYSRGARLQPDQASVYNRDVHCLSGSLFPCVSLMQQDQKRLVGVGPQSEPPSRRKFSRYARCGGKSLVSASKSRLEILTRYFTGTALS